MTPKELAKAIKEKVGSQENAAKLCGIHQTTFSRIESGSDPKWSVMRKMVDVARELNVKIDLKKLF